MINPKILYDIDYLLLAITLALVTFGVITIAGATASQESFIPWYEELWFSQACKVILGLIFLFIVLCVDYQLLIRYATLFYIAGLIGLVLCFVPFFSHFKNGAYSWIKIGGLPQIQPSEFAKITTILMLAKVLAAKKEQWYGFIDLMKPLAIGAIPSILIAKQPDTGTALVFVPITVIMMFVAGLPYSYLLLLISPIFCFLGISHDPIFILIWLSLMGIILLIVTLNKVPWSVYIPFLLLSFFSYFIVYEYGQAIWNEIPEYQKMRLIGYIQPETDLKNTNYNINQSKIALGSGGFWGKGLGKGTQSTLDFLPEHHHDFIFPVLGEQAGFIGSVILLVLFLLLLVRGLDTSVESKTIQGALIASGIVTLFFSHIFINVGMVTGLLPVTGLPLTFISYGGSFMLANMIGVGLIMNVRMRGQREMLKDSIFVSRSQMSLPAKISDDF